MQPSDATIEKAAAIMQGCTIDDQHGERTPLHAAALALALLTSASKAERETGKTMVRQWKNRTPNESP